MSSTEVLVYDDRPCELGEGLLWHPERQQLFWFDILNCKLLTRTAQGDQHEWRFDEYMSAAGWIDRSTLLIAGETGLYRFDLDSGKTERLCELEADNPLTRSNDGRADPWGGFWIGTMGKHAEPEAGAIYRFYRGKIRRLISAVTIPNAICFSPQGEYLYFADTEVGVIWRQRLNAADGWPEGEPEQFINCSEQGLNPDGAVIDTQGRLWNAQWGAARVTCYDRDGAVEATITLPASQITCPAFGGPDMRTLFVSSAREHLYEPELSLQPDAGKVFSIVTDITGREEPRVRFI